MPCRIATPLAQKPRRSSSASATPPAPVECAPTYLMKCTGKESGDRRRRGLHHGGVNLTTNSTLPRSSPTPALHRHPRQGNDVTVQPHVRRCSRTYEGTGQTSLSGRAEGGPSVAHANTAGREGKWCGDTTGVYEREDASDAHDAHQLPIVRGLVVVQLHARPVLDFVVPVAPGPMERW